ncbi:hypothetical protein [Nonlabens antarcticus]|uniref:hypothetical protein n=1 Tax=Nonlabens antarcticus TaxID=392714 RepID=UPI001890B7DD|nr:hypothetical protein [Nonlabens antarcticus]
MKNNVDYLDWTREEFMAYVMSYAARLDIDHSSDERTFIRNHVALTDYVHIQNEIKKDSDVEALEKIDSYGKEHNFSLLDKDLILVEVKKMFEFNDETTAMEEGIMGLLRKIFN